MHRRLAALFPLVIGLQLCLPTSARATGYHVNLDFCVDNADHVLVGEELEPTTTELVGIHAEDGPTTWRPRREGETTNDLHGMDHLRTVHHYRVQEVLYGDEGLAGQAIEVSQQRVAMMVVMGNTGGVFNGRPAVGQGPRIVFARDTDEGLFMVVLWSWAPLSMREAVEARLAVPRTATTVEVSLGGFDLDGAPAVVEDARQALERQLGSQERFLAPCLAAGAQHGAAMHGRIQLVLEVGEDGCMARVELVEDGLGWPPGASCILDLLKSWCGFAAAAGARAAVVLTVTTTPSRYGSAPAIGLPAPR